MLDTLSHLFIGFVAVFHPINLLVLVIGLILGIYTRPVAVLTGLFLLVASWASWRVSAGKWMWNFGGAEYPLFWAVCCFVVALQA